MDENTTSRTIVNEWIEEQALSKIGALTIRDVNVLIAAIDMYTGMRVRVALEKDAEQRNRIREQEERNKQNTVAKT